MGIAFGAVYFRGFTPQERDWERDYRRAAEDGLTQFRHWLPWAAIEREPGVFCWESYDALIRLGERYGIRTVLAEMSTIVPDWFFAQHEEARMENRRGSRAWNTMNDSAMAGGASSLCMDHPAVREGVRRFLTAMGEHFRGADNVLGYDVWNECSLYSEENLCFCAETEREFRQWLRAKYGTPEALAEAWRRHSYTDWEQIRMPRERGLHPEFLDAVRFRADQQERWFAWRIQVLREADSRHLIIAHGNGKSHSDIATCCGDDWRYAGHVDRFGYTLWYANHCHPMMGGDMIRSACEGKEFWRAEAIGDATWEQRSDGTLYEAKKDEMADPAHIRMDALMSIVAGARAYLNPRYRGLDRGRLFHAYGWYAPDGERTARSQEIRALAAWCRREENRALWQAGPQRGQLGILLLEEAQALCYALFGKTEIFASCLRGSWKAFFDAGIQADIVRMTQIEDYDLLYVPYPAAVADDDMERLRQWVKRGGTLISEACFGYFDGTGRAQESQPNRGFAEVFGCLQETVHLGPDQNKRLVLEMLGGSVYGGVYRQSLTLREGKAVGWFEDGSTAAVMHSYGAGRALLLGSMPGYGYEHRETEEGRLFFASLLRLAGKEPEVRIPYQRRCTARLWRGKDSRFLWVCNFAESEREIEVYISPDGVQQKRVESIRQNLPDGAQKELADSARQNLPEEEALQNGDVHRRQIHGVRLLRGASLRQTGECSLTVRVAGNDAAVVELKEKEGRQR